MIRAPSSPPIVLPHLPESLNIQRLCKSGSLEEWEHLWSQLGFKRWRIIQEEVHGETLERHIERQALANHEKLPRNKQPLIRPSISALHHTHVLLHPSGLLAVMDTYQSNGQWMFNEIKIEGCVDNGFSDPHSRVRNPDGSSCRSITCSSRSGDGQVLEVFWSNLVSAAQAGRLLPFHKWRRLESGLHLEDAPDWKTVPVTGALATPSERYKARDRLLAKHYSVLMAHWQPQLEQAPFGFGAVLLGALKKKVVYAAQQLLPPGRVLATPFRAWACEQLEGEHDHMCLPGMALAEILSSLSPPMMWLHPKEQDKVIAWLEFARPATPPSHTPYFIKQHAAENIADGKVEVLDILLANPLLPGSIEKAAQLIAHMSNDELLVRMTQENSRGFTLGLQLSLALMTIPQRRCEEEDLAASQKDLLEVLDAIVARVGAGAMVLETSRRTAWEGALGMAFNAPMDEDLIAHHHPRVQAWLSWATGHAVPLPLNIVGHIARASDEILRVPVLADWPQFEAAWEQAGGEHPTRLGKAVDRWNLLEPVRRYFRHHQLQTVLQQSAGPSLPRPRM